MDRRRFLGALQHRERYAERDRPHHYPGQGQGKPTALRTGPRHPCADKGDENSSQTNPRTPTQNGKRVAQVDKVQPICRPGAADHQKRNRRGNEADNNDQREVSRARR